MFSLVYFAPGAHATPAKIHRTHTLKVSETGVAPVSQGYSDIQTDFLGYKLFLAAAAGWSLDFIPAL